MEIWLAIMFFILGLCCGSFVNMLVYRTAIEYGLIKSKGVKKKSSFLKMLGGRSFCDYCGKQLYWYENVPVISWLIQKGKTRCCGKKLPVAYPIVEVITGLLFLLNFKFLTRLPVGQVFNQIQNQNFLNLNFKTVLELVLSFVIITFLVFSTVFDLKYMILPDFSTIILVICAMVFLFVETPDLASLQGKALSAIISFGFLYFLYLITKKKGMGLGDAKLAIFMGLFLGRKVVLAFYVAFIVGALVAIFLMLAKKANKKTKIAFGPFLILGIIVSWFWGDIMLASYF